MSDEKPIYGTFDLTPDARIRFELLQAIRAIVAEELAKALAGDDEEETPKLRVVSRDPREGLDVTLTYEGRRYEGTVFLVEEEAHE